MKSDGILAQVEGTALEKMGSAEAVLKHLSAEDIKHIEVITEPGSEYDATYSAVIKIKTKRKKTRSKYKGTGAGGTEKYRL